MPINPAVRRELHRRWRGPPSPYREAFSRVHEELGNHVVACRYVTPEQVNTRVSGRIKAIPRIIEKVDRFGKRPTNTLEELEELEELITDIVGVRVTVDYLTQAQQIRDWVVSHDRWTISMVDDTIRETGYRAIHIDLKVDTTHFPGVRCEIQVRTLLQDAWAIWSHPIYEKYRRNVALIPEQKRQLMRQLSDMLHTVDEMVQTLLVSS